MKDLSDEVEGMSGTLLFTETLDRMTLPGTSIIEDVARIHEKLAHTEFGRASNLGAAWIRDTERVLR